MYYATFKECLRIISETKVLKVFKEITRKHSTLENVFDIFRQHIIQYEMLGKCILFLNRWFNSIIIV